MSSEKHENTADGYVNLLNHPQTTRRCGRIVHEVQGEGSIEEQESSEGRRQHLLFLEEKVCASYQEEGCSHQVVSEGLDFALL